MSSWCSVPIPEPAVANNERGQRNAFRRGGSAAWRMRVCASPASRAITPSFQDASHGLNKYLSEDPVAGLGNGRLETDVRLSREEEKDETNEDRLVS